MDADNLKDVIEQLREAQELIRQLREATRMAAETAELALGRLQIQQALVEGSIAWRHAADKSEFGEAITHVVRASNMLRDLVDDYENHMKKVAIRS